MSLYNDYRPQTLDDVMGNAAEIKSIKKLLSKGNIPQAFFLTGQSGCGKTTIARILAKEIGASDLSIKEINSADNRGIDTGRMIIEQMRFRSPDGSPTVFIIDEFHQTSKDFQNAMLKPLEDTPDNVYFFICTTDPGKIIQAIKTRCTPIKLSALSAKELSGLVLRTALQANIDLPDEIIQSIAENSDGSPRQALVLLEKISDMDDKEEMKAIIQSGVVSASVKALCQALLKDGAAWKTVNALIKQIEEEPEAVRRMVMGYMSAVLLNSGERRAAIVLECFIEPFYNSGKPGLVLACYQSINTD